MSKASKVIQGRASALLKRQDRPSNVLVLKVMRTYPLRLKVHADSRRQP